MLIPPPAPLPVPEPLTSYWQIPLSRLQNHRTTPDLPTEADYVVIGGGLSGSCLAYRLLEKQPDAKVLLLEARNACSGASGRNGGHCRPGRYTTFLRDTAIHGAAEAASIARFEETNVRDLAAFVRIHRISCLLEAVTTVDICEAGTETVFESTLAAIAARKIALADFIAAGNADERTIHTAAEARERFKQPRAIGAVSFPAYSINPYRFVCGVLELALEKGLNLQTGTPVEGISHNSDDNLWTVKTDRGSIKAQNVLLATNAYTSHLLPQASRFIMPVRNQALAIKAGSRISKTGILDNHSLCWRYPTSQPGVLGDDYMTSKPANPELSSDTQTRDLVLGGGRHLAPHHEEYNTNDSCINVDVSTYLRETLQSQHFGNENWGDDLGEVLKEWTGIVGHTPDENPVLGAVPGMPGLWICAGFTGHGMALAFRSAQAVAGMVCGEELDWVPGSFLCGRKGVEVLAPTMNRMRNEANENS